MYSRAAYLMSIALMLALEPAATAGPLIAKCCAVDDGTDGDCTPCDGGPVISADAGVGDPDAGVPADAAGPPPDACIPLTCEEIAAPSYSLPDQPDDAPLLCGEYDDGCGGVIECGDCECNGFAINPPKTTIEVKFKKGVKLPIVGWRIGADLDISLGGDYDPATCHNGCESSYSIQGNGNLGLELKDKVEIGLEGSHESSTTYCKECNEDTCEEECTEKSCEDKSFSLTGTASYTKYLGMRRFQFKPFGSISFGFKCGAEGTLSGGGGGSAEKTIPGTCEPCQDCFEWGGHGEIGVGVKVNCALDYDVWGWSGSFGCKGCASIAGNTKLGVSKQSGSCGNDLCGKLEGKASITVFAHKCISLRWFSVFLSAGGTAWGKGTTVWGGNSCGQTGYDGDIDGWVKVSSSCPKRCICCDGSQSPTCKPGDGSWRGCCSHHGGICDARCMP